MATRRGMGKGRGKGYSNITGKDPSVHSDSARGRKQPQRINSLASRGIKTANRVKPIVRQLILNIRKVKTPVKEVSRERVLNNKIPDWRTIIAKTKKGNFYEVMWIDKENAEIFYGDFQSAFGEPKKRVIKTKNITNFYVNDKLM